MDSSSSTLFRSPHPHQSVTALFLIENSQEMFRIWTDLRDKYLNGLVNTLVNANSSIPVSASILESCSPNSNPTPRHYHNCFEALQGVSFDFNPSNKITTSRINLCIDFLDTAKYQGQPPATHLIIVAATTPVDDSTGYMGNAYAPWVHLSQKLKAKNIQCHLVVSPHNDMGSLTFLFEETLRQQGNVEEFLYPPSEPSPILMRLSKPNFELQNDIRATTASYPPARAGVPRRNSYPLDNFYSENPQDGSGAPVNGDVEQPMSLVSQLQQVHGLTKKKVYGAKPIRQPFVREERTRERYQQTPPLTMPMPIMDPNPSPTAGGRTMSQSRTDRIGRLTQGSPTDLHSGARRQHGWPRRGSRLSTPEADGYGWPSSPSVLQDNSPGSSTSYMSSSPVTPVTSFEEVYQHPVQPPCVPSMGPPAISPGMAAYQTGGIAEGTWDPTQLPRHVGSYNPSIQTYFPPATANFYSDSGRITTLPEMPPPPPPTQSTPAATIHMQQQPTVAPPPPSQPPVSTPPRASTTKKVTSDDDDDERFVFGEDFVTATAALFEAEVLPAYPNYPGMSSGLFTNDRVEQGSQSLLSSQAGELYATRHKQNSAPQAASAPPPPASSNVNMFTANNNAHNAHINFGPPPHPQGQYTRTQVQMANMIGNQPSAAYSYGVPAHAAAYSSSLTGWAG